MTEMDWLNSVALVTGSDQERFGTAFQILKDEEFSYFLTCAHVLADVGGIKGVKVNESEAEVIVIGNKDGFDVAILKTAATNEFPVFNLSIYSEEITTNSFITIGYYKLNNTPISIDKVEGILEQKSAVYDRKYKKNVTAWRLKVDENSSLQKGYSGSPVIDKSNNIVFGILSHKQAENKGLAISVEVLTRIWENRPSALIDTPQGHKNLVILLKVLKEYSALIQDCLNIEFGNINQLIYSISVRKITYTEAVLFFKNHLSNSLHKIDERIKELEETSNKANHFSEPHNKLVDIRNQQKELIVNLEKIRNRIEEEIRIKCRDNQEKFEKCVTLEINKYKIDRISFIFDRKKVLEEIDSHILEELYPEIIIELQQIEQVFSEIFIKEVNDLIVRLISEIDLFEIECHIAENDPSGISKGSVLLVKPSDRGKDTFILGQSIWTCILRAVGQVSYPNYPISVITSDMMLSNFVIMFKRELQQIYFRYIYELQISLIVNILEYSDQELTKTHSFLIQELSQIETNIKHDINYINAERNLKILNDESKFLENKLANLNIIGNTLMIN